jgi:hypothetical protein
LLFLLNSAPSAGLPIAIEEDPALSERSLRWILHQLAQRLVPVAATDPAALALAGLSPDARVPSGAEPTEAEVATFDMHAARWRDLTLAALWRAAPAEEAEVPTTLWRLARRPGWVEGDPGWLEVRLELNSVDLAIRRAGLDVDPGWVDWLGVVVRFCYV